MTEQKDLRSALEACRAQFQFYADEHKAKSDAAYNAWDDARYWGNVDEQNSAHKEYHKRLTQTQTNEAMVKMIDQALASDTIGRGGEHWSRQGIVKIIINAMAEAKGDVKAVPAGKAADHILSYLAPALSHPPAAEPVGLREAGVIVTRTIERLRSLPDYAGRPAWEVVIAEELHQALATPARTDDGTQPAGDTVALREAVALEAYRAAVRWVASDSWDGCSDCIKVLQMARSLDDFDWTPCQHAAALKRLYERSGSAVRPNPPPIEPR